MEFCCLNLLSNLSVIWWARWVHYCSLLYYLDKFYFSFNTDYWLNFSAELDTLVTGSYCWHRSGGCGCRKEGRKFCACTRACVWSGNCLIVVPEISKITWISIIVLPIYALCSPTVTLSFSHSIPCQLPLLVLKSSANALWLISALVAFVCQ